jgi:hypothetical protein
MSLEDLLGKPHYDYKLYIDKFNIVMEAIEEIAFLSNTLDYKRLVVFFKEIIETFEFFKNIDENDDNSEGFSNMNNKDDLILSIIDCDEYKNLVNFMETYKNTIIRKCDKLKEKIEGLQQLLNDSKTNDYILKDFRGNIDLMNLKMQKIDAKLLDNINASLPHIKIEKINFNIKLITKNDIICILSSYQFLKKFIYKHMHVIDKEYYTPTKEDVIEFRNELYNIYTQLYEYFNKNKNNYVEDISTKFRDVLKLVEYLEEYGDTVNAVVDTNAVVDANAVEATDTAIGAEDYGEGDEDIAKEKIDTNDENTGDKGLKKAKQLQELETEEQDNKNRSVIAKKIEKKEPAPALTPAQALGLEHTNTKKEDENEADFRKLEEIMNNTEDKIATPLEAAQGMLEGEVQQQTKQLTALADAANERTEQIKAKGKELTDAVKERTEQLAKLQKEGVSGVINNFIPSLFGATAQPAAGIAGLGRGEGTGIAGLGSLASLAANLAKSK